MPRRKPSVHALQGTPDDIEAQFYEALQQADIARLMAVWADEDEIVCVHPGGDRLVGNAAIRASFEALFAAGAVPVQPQQVRRLQLLGSALHHLVERIEPPGASDAVWVLATNVYVRTALGWRMAAHHASPAGPQRAAEPADAPSTLH